ncbi:MAG TPA: hypothetical protein VEI97_20180, partial [bacterium]|nr:hypothetical protein [bacterium]
GFGRLAGALIGTALLLAWFAPLVPPALAPRGLLLRDSEAPELYRLVREALREARIGGPVMVELTADASLSLAPPRHLPHALLGMPRQLSLGMALLDEVTADELRSLVAATAAQWGGGGYAAGGLIHRITLGLDGAGHAFGSGGCLQFINPLFWITAALAQLLQDPRLVRHLAYQRPLFHDALGVRAGGSMTYYAAQEKAALNEAIWEATAYHVIFDLMEQGKQLKNLFAYFAERKAEVEPVNISMLRDEVYSDTTGTVAGGGGRPEPVPGLQYPSLSQRLARVMHLPYQEERDKRRARALLPNPAALEEALTQKLTQSLDLALQTAKQEMWEDQQREIQLMKDEYEARR